MIVLETNVVSEPLRPAPDPAVLAWLDRQAVETLFLTTIGLAELRYGIAVLPEGQRRHSLQAALETRIVPLFGVRILAFDQAAAEAYGLIRAREGRRQVHRGSGRLHRGDRGGQGVRHRDARYRAFRGRRAGGHRSVA